jgi:hypothetical protein
METLSKQELNTPRIMSIDNYNKQVVNPLIEILSEKRISM